MTFEEDEQFKKLLEMMPALIRDNTALMQCYTKKAYMPAIKRFSEKYLPVMRLYESCMEAYPESQKQITEAAALSLINAAGILLDNKKSHSGKLAYENEIQTYRQVFAAFIIPGIGETKTAYASRLNQAVQSLWCERYEKYPFVITDAATLQNGFRLTGGCYITSAVMKARHESDHCYELMAFRAYRDGYLSKRPQGPALIEEYYRTAPRIVAAINSRQESSHVYQEIWDQYLGPCLSCIEKSENEKCLMIYSDMVHTLQKTYL